MTSSKQTVALALTGAVALASGAYTLGSQAGGGDAAAAKSPGPSAVPYGPGPGFRRGFGPAGRPNLSGLADRLGVSEAKLRAALEAVRPGQRHDRDDLAQELADALGIDVAKVTAAFDKVRAAKEKELQARRDAFAKELAAKLGIDASKVQDALADFAPPFWPGRRHP